MKTIIVHTLTAVFSPLRWLILVMLFSASQPAWSALTHDVERGLSWLTTQVQTDGSLSGEAASDAVPVQVRSEVERTIHQISGQKNLALADALIAEPENNTEFLARKILSADVGSVLVSDMLSTLLLRQNSDGGFGPAQGYASSVIDTAFAMEAMAKVDVAATPASAGAVSFLLSLQGADGGFHLSSAASDHYATALAMHALWRYRFFYSVGDALNKAGTFLLSVRGVDGLWISADQTALALIALLPTMTTADPLLGTVTSLLSMQGASGAWNADPYATALVLRALTTASALTTNPDLASLKGRVVDGSSGLPIGAVEVSLTGKSIQNVSTDSSGAFAFSNLIAGTYEFNVDKSGYGGIKGSVGLNPGQVLGLGDMVLLPIVAPTTATLRGVVSDATTGAAINGATVSAGGGSATTNNLGAYEIKGIAPGALNIRVSASGYFAALESATVSAGQTLIFSPTLTRSASTTTALRGVVRDRSTDAPLGSATVTLAGANTHTITTNNAGEYSVSGLVPGDTKIEISKAGYIKATANVVLEVSQTYDFSPALDALPPASTTNPSLSGRITDALTHTPIGVATVGLNGTNSATVRGDANGYYQFADLLPGRTIAAFSAPGYKSFVITTELAVDTSHSVSVGLYPEGYVNPEGAIAGRAVDAISLQPVSAPVIFAEMDEQTRLYAIGLADGRFTIDGGLEGSWKIIIGRSGYQDYVTDVIIPSNGKVALGDVKLLRQSEVSRLPDLIVSMIDRSSLASDPLSFSISGVVDVQISNIGNATATQPFTIRAYIDVNANHQFDPGVDVEIGTGRVNDPLPERGFSPASLTVNAVLPFRDAPFRIEVDSGREIVELNEINNEASSADLGVCK